jgi:hypothetical protein
MAFPLPFALLLAQWAHKGTLGTQAGLRHHEARNFFKKMHRRINVQWNRLFSRFTLLSVCRINNLRILNIPCPTDSVPGHHLHYTLVASEEVVQPGGGFNALLLQALKALLHLANWYVSGWPTDTKTDHVLLGYYTGCHSHLMCCHRYWSCLV